MLFKLSLSGCYLSGDINMQTIEPLDLSALPKHAQDEVYDFYLFLKQRYLQKLDNKATEESCPDEALQRFLENNKKRRIYVDSNINLSELANEVNDTEI